MARASAGLQSHEKMLVPSVHPLLWLFVLFPGETLRSRPTEGETVLAGGFGVPGFTGVTKGNQPGV